MNTNCQYKYMEFSIDAIKSILCDEIWYSHPNSLNDPFEFSAVFNKDLPDNLNDLAIFLKSVNYFAPKSHQKVERDIALKSCLHGDYATLKEWTLQKLDLLEKSFFQALDENPAYVSCMSKLNDQPLMWSHYAKSYTGICIAYDIDSLNQQGHEYKDVNYDKVFASMDFKFITSDDNSGLLAQLDRVLRTKNTDWEYEQEVRSIKSSNNGKDVKGFLKKCTNGIRSITFGYRMSQKEQNLLHELARLKGVPLYIARPMQNEYKVKIDPVNNSGQEA